MKPVFCLIVSLLVFLTLVASAGQPTAPLSGNTSFDVADRLAITNLFGAMIYGLDEKLLDQIMGTLAPDFEAEYKIPGEQVQKVSGRDAFEKMMSRRFENFKAEGIQRRHIITAPYFLEQTADSARVVIHILNCTMTNHENWHPFVSAMGEFRVAKRDGVWAFTHQIEVVDSKLDMPLSKVLPSSAPQK